MQPSTSLAIHKQHPPSCLVKHNDTYHHPHLGPAYLPSRELEAPVDARADLDVVGLVLGRDDAVADEEVEQD